MKAKNMEDIIEDAKRDIRANQSKCQHKKTVALNEEGHAGIYCVDCEKQLEKEC